MNFFFRCSLHFICKKNSKTLNFSAIVSIIGIAFGVFSFLTVVTILDTFQFQMKSIISSVNPNLTIFSHSGIPDIKTSETNILSIMKNKIDKISPFVYHESVLAYKKQTSAVYIRAIPGTKSATSENLAHYIYPKNALELLNQPSISETQVILGKELADNLGVTLNSVVTLMTFDTKYNKIPKIKYNKLKVSGFFNVGLAQYDKQYILMNFEDGVRLFGAPNWASGFEITLKKPDLALLYSTEYAEKLPYSMIAWQEIDANLFHQIKRDSAVIKIIVLIISIVGVFNILITLGLTVLDRVKQIALLRSLGATKNHIIYIFMCIGGILGCLGAMVGTIFALLALLCIKNISLGDLNKFYYLSKIPVKFDLWLTCYVFVAAIVLSLIGALYPAWKASKTPPIAGLR